MIRRHMPVGLVIIRELAFNLFELDYDPGAGMRVRHQGWFDTLAHIYADAASS